MRHRKIEPNGARADPFVGENHRPQDRLSMVQGGEIRTKEIHGGKEEINAMCIINKEVRRPSRLQRNKLPRASKNRPIIEIANLENDEFSNVENDVKF